MTTGVLKPIFWNNVFLLIYAIGCTLMARIVLQYIPAGTDTAFLGTKQDYVHIPIYLPAFYVHVFTALFALPAGFTQFSTRIQQQYPYLHRQNGRLYVWAILLLGGPSGLIIGLFANGGISSQLSFCLLAIFWMYFTGRGVQHAIQGNIKAHRAYMYRSFALTLSALTLRAWKYILVVLFHPHPMDVYRVIAWLGWTLNLAIAEWIIYKRRNI